MKETSLPCRLCLSHYSKHKLFNVFTCTVKHSEDSLVDVLFWVFSVEVDVTDSYSKNICKECLILVEYVMEIRNMFRKNQENMRKDQHDVTLENSKVHLFDTIKDDICNTQDENAKEPDNSEVLKKDVGVATDLSWASKAVNTDESFMLESSLIKNGQVTTLPVTELLTAANVDGKLNDNVDSLTMRKDISFSSSSLDHSDQANVAFRRDVSTNTEHSSFSSTKSVGINAIAEMVESGTLTKKFKIMKKKDVVRVNIKLLDTFSPKVWLEPVEYLMGRENYKEVNDFCFVKDNIELKREWSELESDQFDEDDTESQTDVVEIKKKRFLDYYNNFSSFAVRELIAGKKIRDNQNEPSPVFKVANVCNVFVCDYCSKSFLTKAVLNLHRKQDHRCTDSSDVTVNQEAQVPVNFKRKRGRPRGSNKSRFDSNNIRRNSIYYNINDILHNKMKVQIPDVKKQRRKVRGRKPGRRLRNNSLAITDQEKDSPYIWDKKGLGTYSAITLYKKRKIGDKKAALNAKQEKQDMSLNETIRKLSDRLEELENSNSDSELTRS